MKDTTVSCSLVLCLALGAASGVHAADKKKAASPAAAAGQAMKDTAGQAVQQAQAQLGQAVSTKVNATLGAVPATVPGAQAAGNGPATAASGSPTNSSAAPKANLGQQLKQQATQAVTAGVGQALAPASPGKGGVADQARAQASQLVVDQVNARVAGGKAPDTSTLGKQVQGQAAQVAGTVAADQIGKLFTPANGNANANANANGNGGGLRAQAGAQVSQTLGSALTQSLSGNRANGAAVAQDLRKGLGQSAANAVAAPVAQKLGGAVPTSSSQFVNTLQQGLQQGVQQNLSAQLQKRAGVSGAPSAPALQASLQGAATQAVQQQLTQAVQGTTGSPLAGDLLILGLKRANVDVPTNAGTFAPPAGSALPVDTQNLRNGVNILTTANGQAGLGVKSSVDVGSQTVEISGAVDPNSSSAQGPSAGVQIKIGGN